MRLRRTAAAVAAVQQPSIRTIDAGGAGRTVLGVRNKGRSKEQCWQGNAVHRRWVAEAIGIIEADFNRSADTHVL